MKKIGYIYKYNEQEEKGILVYGHKVWISSYYSGSPWYKPIKFSLSNCISDIQEERLVYFNLVDEKTAHEIECASLGNFRKDIIENIDTESSHYICFENLLDDNYICFENLPDEMELDFFKDDYVVQAVQALPESIDELYALFDNPNHINFDDIPGLGAHTSSIYIDILDISLWIDKNISLSSDYYGKTAEQVICLYSLFVENEKLKFKDRPISSAWGKLLALLSEESLMEVYKNINKFQPTLPESFCLKHLNILSVDYGFPSKLVCLKYFKRRISNLNTTTEYEYLSEKIAVPQSETNQNGNGFFIEQLDSKERSDLQKKLEKRYTEVVLTNLKNELNQISNNRIDGEQRIEKLISRNRRSYIIKLGVFVDNLNFVRDGIRNNENVTVWNLMNSYYNLLITDRKRLNALMKNLICEYSLYIALKEGVENKAFILYDVMENYNHSKWISTQAFDRIKGLVNTDFSKLGDLKELEYAYNGNFISEEQFLEQYKILTNKYTVEQFFDIVQNSWNDTLPLSIQEYLIREIVSRFNFNGLLSGTRVKTFFNTVFDVESLIEWLNWQKTSSHLNEQLVDAIIAEMVLKLNKKDRWYLFENGVIESPLTDCIREHLDEAYSEHNLSNNIFQKDCFQYMMLEDVLNATDSWKVFWIIDSLKQQFKAKVVEKGSGLLRFYIWASNPNEKVDWNLFKENFSLLPGEMIIRIFRYLFYLKAFNKIDFSLESISLALSGSSNYLCTSLQAMCLILDKKSRSLDAKISPDEIQELIGGCNDFFYKCYGPRKLSMQQIDFEDYKIYGTVRKELIDGLLYYVISFYKYPKNYYGYELYDDFEVDYIVHVKSVLEQNFSYKIINGNYYISSEYEFDIRMFVISYRIDDKCGLFNDGGEILPLRMNIGFKYTDDPSYTICKCCNSRCVDPDHGIPFYWCNKKICTQRGRFLVPLSEWEEYKFIDLLNISCGNDASLRWKLWEVNAEISQSLETYMQVLFKDENETDAIASISITTESDQGEWTKDMSIIEMVYPHYDDNDCEDYRDYYDSDVDNCDNLNIGDEEPTYEEYRGSWAQDVMGYSDEDIDTIFDGDPDAYWNID